MKITLQQVQQNIGNIANRNEYTADVIYELLAAYGRSKSAITQLREGHLNKAEDEDAVLQKDLVYFKTFAAGTPLEDQVEKLYEDPLTQRYKPRYIIATDLTLLTAKDRIKGTNLAIKLADIDDHLDFLYWWTGDEVVDTKTEAVADRRAADKMNELYVEIEKQNGEAFATNPQFRHELNVFFTRLLFCLFAEDTNIYENDQFTNSIKTYTQTDGSDLAWYFSELFTSLDTEDKAELKSPFKEFPYVNGSIFNTTKHTIAIPKFSAQARHLILECGRQNWAEINPDIFGVMFQGVVDPEHRDENGMDYTSVPNIMKVIQPLFLDSLHEEFDKHYDNEKKLWALLGRVQKIKVFDPACGSGNFLIIAYKEMRQLQHAIIGRIDEIKPAGLGGGIPDNQLINIHNFCGIEIDDFAHELAVLSLFLTKHQMNQEFTQRFGKALSIIPLIDIPTIVNGNSARIDWQTVCPNVGHTVTAMEQSALFEIEGEQSELQLGSTTYEEIYLVGNPPYKGGKKIKNPTMKEDVKLAHNGKPYSKNVDYISIWFLKAGRYIKDTSAKYAFVSTNSICQGEQVGMFWPYLLEKLKLEIIFAYTSFKWQNSARDQAGVTCVIVGLANSGHIKNKYVFTDGLRIDTSNINAYLVPDGSNTVVEKRGYVLSGLPRMSLGSMPKDGGGLILSEDKKNEICDSDIRASKYIKRYIGSDSFLNGIQRYCLWIDDSDVEDAMNIPAIKARIDIVKEYRARSDAESTRDFASKPHRFIQRAYKPTNQIIVPRISTERRKYIPLGLLDGSYVVSDGANVIYDAEPYIFSILNSIIHNVWVKAVSGGLETRINYSSTICYNSFPIHPLNEAEEDVLNRSARRILLARAAYPEKTLANMYDPNKMPDALREAHNQNDNIVDSLYLTGGFTNDEDRLSALFALYEQLTAKVKTK